MTPSMAPHQRELEAEGVDLHEISTPRVLVPARDDCDVVEAVSLRPVLPYLSRFPQCLPLVRSRCRQHASLLEAAYREA